MRQRTRQAKVKDAASICVLEQAIERAMDGDPRSAEVHRAIDYLSARCIRQGGINLILAGLREGRADYMAQGSRF